MDGLLMSVIPMIFAAISSTNTNPSTVVAMTLSAVSTALVIWKAVQLGYRVRIARKITEQFELIASSKRASKVRETESGKMNVSDISSMDRVNSALKLLSEIDLESYLFDRGMRNRIDNSLAVLYSELSDNDDKRTHR